MLISFGVSSTKYGQIMAEKVINSTRVKDIVTTTWKEIGVSNPFLRVFRFTASID